MRRRNFRFLLILGGVWIGGGFLFYMSKEHHKVSFVFLSYYSITYYLKDSDNPTLYFETLNSYSLLQNLTLDIRTR